LFSWDELKSGREKSYITVSSGALFYFLDLEIMHCKRQDIAIGLNFILHLLNGAQYGIVDLS
jgi:hypothetical protein